MSQIKVMHLTISIKYFVKEYYGEDFTFSNPKSINM